MHRLWLVVKYLQASIGNSVNCAGIRYNWIFRLQTLNHYKFAGLFFVQAMSRGILLTVLPLQAYSRLGNAQLTSSLFFAVAIGGILASLIMPIVIRKTGNHRAFLLGSAAMLISAVLFSFDQTIYFAIGLFFHSFSVASIEVSLTLYVLAGIPRRELTRFEPMRIFSTVLALSIGPFLGVYFQEKITADLPYWICAGFVVISYGYFRWLGLHQVNVQSRNTVHVSPVNAIRRYIAQPRLRLAYGLILARSAWWTMFVIYMPIYCEQAGLGELVGAAIVSIGTGWTLTVPFWGWVARRYGVRRLLQIAFSSNSLILIVVYQFSHLPWIAVSLMIVCALSTTVLDGVGNILFFRAVRGHERAGMTAVFATYRDAGQLITPGVYALLLKLFALPVVFSTAAVWMAVASYYSRYVPAKMK
jgi:ACDE family multidrug resistance protein